MNIWPPRPAGPADAGRVRAATRAMVTGARSQPPPQPAPTYSPAPRHAPSSVVSLAPAAHTARQVVHEALLLTRVIPAGLYLAAPLPPQQRQLRCHLSRIAQQGERRIVGGEVRFLRDRYRCRQHERVRRYQPCSLGPQKAAESVALDAAPAPSEWFATPLPQQQTTISVTRLDLSTPNTHVAEMDVAAPTEPSASLREEPVPVVPEGANEAPDEEWASFYKAAAGQFAEDHGYAPDASHCPRIC